MGKRCAKIYYRQNCGGFPGRFKNLLSEPLGEFCSINVTNVTNFTNSTNFADSTGFIGFDKFNILRGGMKKVGVSKF